MSAVATAVAGRIVSAEEERRVIVASSVGTVFQKAIALSQFLPLGANGLPER